MVTIYSAEICPFAQRTRALLTRLNEPFTTRTVDLANRDSEFLKLTPTGKVPLMVDGNLRLYESQVINDYLAEKLGWEQAYSADLGLRARQRLAMKIWDGDLLDAFYRTLRSPESLDTNKSARLRHGLEELADTVSTMGSSTDNLLSIHCAPFWARMDWLRQYSPLAGLIDTVGGLRGWLGSCITMPAITATLPDREETVGRYLQKFVQAR